MSPNKFIFRLFENKSGGDSVYVLLADEKIFARFTVDEFFQKQLYRGCFIEYLHAPNEKELEQGVMAFAKRLGCHEVSAEEYIELEKKGEGQRAQEALATAERMIKEG